MAYLDFQQTMNVKLDANADIPVNDNIPDDNDWLEDSFMVKSKDIDFKKVYDNIYDIDTYKFTDTSMGGSVSINVYPQFTRYADIRFPSKLMDRNEVTVTSTSGNYGMGHYYSEAIDDNSTDVYFEFGVPNFNNILFYFLSATDYKTAVIANEGRSPLFYELGKITGSVALIMAFPYITIPLLLAKGVISFLGNMGVFPGRFDYYSVKPTMYNYWATVNSITTMMATELGLLSPMFKNSTDTTKVGIPLGLDQDDLDAMQKLLPGIVTTGNVINVHAMIGGAQKKLMLYRSRQLDQMQKLGNGSPDPKGGTDSDVLNALKFKAADLKPKDIFDQSSSVVSAIKADKTYQDAFTKKDKSLLDELKGLNVNNTKNFFNKSDTKYIRKLRNQDKDSYISSALNTFKAIANEGARYAIFRVEDLGSVTDSVSSSTTSVDAVDAINNMGKAWRSIKFNLDGGNVPILGSLIKGMTDFAAGNLDGITAGLSNVVGSFLSGMELDVPMRWDNTNFNLPSLNFKMKLISPSAHPIAQLRGIYIPLAALLAAALPRSTGPRSYTSPFVCSMFVRGYQRVTLGMITSLTITRGTSNLPFNKLKRPLAVDVSFTVTDFSQVLMSPTPSSLLSPGDIAFDDESGIARYISSLCGRDLFSSTHVSSKFKIKASTFLKSYVLALQPETLGALAGDFVSSNWFFESFTDNINVGNVNDILGNSEEFNKYLMGES